MYIIIKLISMYFSYILGKIAISIKLFIKLLDFISSQLLIKLLNFISSHILLFMLNMLYLTNAYQNIPFFKCMLVKILFLILNLMLILPTAYHMM